jgi:predicted esterase
MCKWWGPKLAYDTIHQCLLMHGHGGYDHGLMEQRLRAALERELARCTLAELLYDLRSIRAELSEEGGLLLG